MKKLVLFLLLISGFAYAQTEYVPSKITFNDGKELNTKIRFHVNLFQENLIDEQSLIGKKIITGDEDIKDVKYLSSDIQKIEFTDLKGQPRIFINDPKYNGKVEILYDGKIKWYRTFYRNGYDHSTQLVDSFQKEGQKRVTLNIFKNNKKLLKELFADKPELIPEIDLINYNRLKKEDLIKILRKYDEI